VDEDLGAGGRIDDAEPGAAQPLAHGGEAGDGGLSDRISFVDALQELLERGDRVGQLPGPLVRLAEVEEDARAGIERVGGVPLLDGEIVLSLLIGRLASEEAFPRVSRVAALRERDGRQKPHDERQTQESTKHEPSRFRQSNDGTLSRERGTANRVLTSSGNLRVIRGWGGCRASSTGR